jgi:hypothetical protein
VYFFVLSGITILIFGRVVSHFSLVCTSGSTAGQSGSIHADIRLAAVHIVIALAAVEASEAIDCVATHIELKVFFH